MKVQLNKFTPAVSYRSRDEFREEAQRQAEWFQNLQSENPAAHQQWGSFLQSGWQNAVGVARNSDIADDDISARIVGQPCVPHGSPVVSRLLWLTENGQSHRAKGAVFYLDSRHDGQNTNVGQQAGAADIAAIFAVQDRIGSSSTRKMLRELLDEHEERLDPLLEKDNAELEAKREEFNQVKSEMEGALNSLKTTAAEFLAKSQADWFEAYNSFTERLKTETAVKLWEDRAKTHTRRYENFRLATVVAAGLGLAASFGWIFEGFHLAASAFPDNQTGQVAAYSAGSILLFTLLVWTIRVLIRSMISEDHLATDASARSAMAHTYLALTREERASNEDRAIILAALFAPVSDGLVKDDGMPILSPTAIAAAAITNPRGP